MNPFHSFLDETLVSTFKPAIVSAIYQSVLTIMPPKILISSLQRNSNVRIGYLTAFKAIKSFESYYQKLIFLFAKYNEFRNVETTLANLQIVEILSKIVLHLECIKTFFHDV
jgi:hypothetical protein